jgi:hypothetical protein
MTLGMTAMPQFPMPFYGVPGMNNISAPGIGYSGMPSYMLGLGSTIAPFSAMMPYTPAPYATTYPWGPMYQGFGATGTYMPAYGPTINMMGLGFGAPYGQPMTSMPWLNQSIYPELGGICPLCATGWHLGLPQMGVGIPGLGTGYMPGLLPMMPYGLSGIWGTPTVTPTPTTTIQDPDIPDPFERENPGINTGAGYVIDKTLRLDLTMADDVETVTLEKVHMVDDMVAAATVDGSAGAIKDGQTAKIFFSGKSISIVMDNADAMIRVNGTIKLNSDGNETYVSGLDGGGYSVAPNSGDSYGGMAKLVPIN